MAEELRIVIEKGSLENVIYLVESSKQIVLDKALCLAAQNGRLDIIKYLVEHGAYIHVNDDEPLRAATIHQCANNSFNIVDYLVTKGAHINARNYAALSNAAYSGHLAIVKYLVEKGADIHANNNETLRAATTMGRLDVIKYLVEHGANVNDDGACRLLVIAAYGGYIDVIKYFVDYGINIQLEHNAALLAAATAERYNVIEYLIQNGADVAMTLRKATLENNITALRCLQPFS